MVIIVLKCPYCESENVVRNGHSPNGKQKYLCKDCKRQTRENPTSRGYSEEEKERSSKRMKSEVAYVVSKGHLEWNAIRSASG